MRTLALAAPLALLLGCSDSPTAPASAHLVVSIALSSVSLAPGEALDWTLTVTNLGQAAGRLDFTSSCHSTLQVSDASGMVWDDMWVRGCATVVSHVDLAPGESTEYQGRWRQQVLGGSAPPGSYRARGELLTTPRLSSADVPFTLRPAG